MLFSAITATTCIWRRRLPRSAAKTAATTPTTRPSTRPYEQTFREPAVRWFPCRWPAAEQRPRPGQAADRPYRRSGGRGRHPQDRARSRRRQYPQPVRRSQRTVAAARRA
ncbi:hypothetical protein [Lysobacter gummosus]|uniref:hypothetical protein n=1 Tax=Lysobacter gummosus TaxID=262324 RepID=UPI00363953CF